MKHSESINKEPPSLIGAQSFTVSSHERSHEEERQEWERSRVEFHRLDFWQCGVCVFLSTYSNQHNGSHISPSYLCKNGWAVFQKTVTGLPGSHFQTVIPSLGGQSHKNKRPRATTFPSPGSPVTLFGSCTEASRLSVLYLLILPSPSPPTGVYFWRPSELFQHCNN